MRTIGDRQHRTPPCTISQVRASGRVGVGWQVYRHRKIASADFHYLKCNQTNQQRSALSSHAAGSARLGPTGCGNNALRIPVNRKITPNSRINPHSTQSLMGARPHALNSDPLVFRLPDLENFFLFRRDAVSVLF